MWHPFRAPTSIAAIGLVLLSACSSTPSVPSSGTQPTRTSLLDDGSHLFERGTPTPEPEPTAGPTSTPSQTIISVDASASGMAIDPRLFGTNLAAWVGADRLKDPTVIARTKALGTTVLRMPGGSWSNSYDWLGCENGDESLCYWTWAAKPSDMLNFAREVGADVIWTVSANGTPQEAAAMVAFANGSVDNTTALGTDSKGRDWKTVGDWARLRAEHGSPEPYNISLWEFGNEVYGGKSGKDCATWGWEEVWTCNGTEYVNGIGSGAERHDGYAQYRTAMRAVDPSIAVGAVGLASLTDWSNWGREVIDAAGSDLDMFVVHKYAYDDPPSQISDVLRQPQLAWPTMAEDLGGALPANAVIALTEYNLVAFQDNDTSQLMTRAVNALYTADTLGQLASYGVRVANQWNLINGKAENGTDYGLMNAETGERLPAYYAFPLWRSFGSTMLPVSQPLPTDTTLSVYAGRTSDGTITLMAINKTDRELTIPVQINGSSQRFVGTADVVSAASLDATSVQLNGVSSPSDTLSDATAKQLGSLESSFSQTFAPYSITLLRLQPAR